MMKNATKLSCAIILLFASTVTLDAQTYTVLTNLRRADGDNIEFGSLIQGADGNLYGVGLYGGAPETCHHSGCGTIFKVTRAGELTVLHEFRVSDGSFPTSLVLGTDENFYGTTSQGGMHYDGTLFRLGSDGTFTTLFNFDRGSGSIIYGTLIQGLDGDLYGTAVDKGANKNGTIFRGSPNTQRGRVLHNFDASDGSAPWAGLTLATDGNFYGTTPWGGVISDNCPESPPPGCGTIFKITSDGAFTTLYEFDGSDGANPFSALMQAANGNFYGTTTQGEAGDKYGSVFKMTPAGILTTLHNFDGPDGSGPWGAIIQATDGNLYGTTMDGGSNYTYGGTVFKIDSQDNVSTIYSFCFQVNCTDGAGPMVSLLQATDGKFYGTTRGGGTHDNGVVFSLDLGLKPFVAFVGAFGRPGQMRGILGQGLTGTTSVSFNGTPANFTVVSDTLIHATVPAGATTGNVTISAPSGVLTSNVPFHVLH